MEEKRQNNIHYEVRNIILTDCFTEDDLVKRMRGYIVQTEKQYYVFSGIYQLIERGELIGTDIFNRLITFRISSIVSIQQGYISHYEFVKDKELCDEFYFTTDGEPIINDHMPPTKHKDDAIIFYQYARNINVEREDYHL